MRGFYLLCCRLLYLHSTHPIAAPRRTTHIIDREQSLRLRIIIPPHRHATAELADRG